MGTLWIPIVFVGIFIALFVVLGLFFRQGKGLMLLAGYNTMPKEEREKIDKEKLGKSAGNLILRFALYFALAVPSVYFRLNWAVIALVAIFAGDAIITTVTMQRDNPGIILRRYSENAKKLFLIGTVLAVMVFIGMGIILFNGTPDPNVIVGGNDVQIKGMYGVTIGFDEIKSITLIEKSMNELGVGERTNGFRNGFGAFGNSLKGHFRSETLGETLLFVRADSSPTIKIERGDGKEDIYISLRDGEATKALYDKLMAAIPE